MPFPKLSLPSLNLGGQECPPRTSSQQQVPGFFVAIIFRILAMWGQQEMGLGSYGGDWDDVPGVGWDYPSTSLRTGCGGYEVQAVFGIGHSVGVLRDI